MGKKKRGFQVAVSDAAGMASQARICTRAILWGIVEKIRRDSAKALRIDRAVSAFVGLDELLLPGDILGEQQQLQQQDQYPNEFSSLPLQFGSAKQNKNKKRKNIEDADDSAVEIKCDVSYSRPCDDNELLSSLPDRDAKRGGLLEHNVYYFHSPAATATATAAADATITDHNSAYSLPRHLRDISQPQIVYVVGIGPTSTAAHPTVMLRAVDMAGEWTEVGQEDSGNEKGDGDGRDGRVLSLECFEVPRRSTYLSLIPAKDCSHVQHIVEEYHHQLMYKKCPADVQPKYWDQRYRLLSKFDDGIILDTESWYSITPEAISKHITEFCIQNMWTHSGRPIRSVLDCFSGCGGNTIPFAARGIPTTSVDMDRQKLLYLRHNAGIYGAADHVELLQAEVYSLLESLLPLSRLKALFPGDYENEEQQQQQQGAHHQHHFFEEDGREVEKKQPQQHQEQRQQQQQPPEQQNLHPSLPIIPSAAAQPTVAHEEVAEEAGIVVTSSSSSSSSSKSSSSLFSSSSSVKSPSLVALNAALTVPTTNSARVGGASAVAGTMTEAPESTAVSSSSSSSFSSSSSTYTYPDVIILSPPWGGPEYTSQPVFDLETDLPCGGGFRLAMMANAVVSLNGGSGVIVYILPRNTSAQQLTYLGGLLAKPYRVESISLGNSKKIHMKVAYYGDIVKNCKT